MKTKDSITTLRENLMMLIASTGRNVPSIAAKGGGKPRTIYNILDKGRGCGLDVADQIAAGVNIPLWTLLIPNLTYDLVSSGELNTLIENYIQADTEGREMILKQASREASMGLREIGDSPNEKPPKLTTTRKKRTKKN
jgi:hypothetical protein